MTTTEAEAVRARAIAEATQQAVTTLRSAEQTVNLLRRLTNPVRVDLPLTYALQDAEDALDRIRRCRVLLDGINPGEAP